LHVKETKKQYKEEKKKKEWTGKIKPIKDKSKERTILINYP